MNITVTAYGESYTCATALKGTNYVHLLDSNGVLITAFDGVTDFSVFTISGGSWTAPTADNSCYLAVVGDDGIIRKGGHRCSDIEAKENKATVTNYTMTASGWNGNQYSFESQYPHATYNIEIWGLQASATDNQEAIYNGARLKGSAATNVATASGDVPAIDIPIILKVTTI